jgi:hypothetical protein
MLLSCLDIGDNFAVLPWLVDNYLFVRTLYTGLSETTAHSDHVQLGHYEIPNSQH